MTLCTIINVHNIKDADYRLEHYIIMIMKLYYKSKVVDESIANGGSKAFIESAWNRTELHHRYIRS